MGPDAIVSVVLSGLVPTIMMAPPSEDGKDGFGAILDQVIADAHALVGDIEIAAYPHRNRCDRRSRRSPKRRDGPPNSSSRAGRSRSSATRRPAPSWRAASRPRRGELNRRANQLARELLSRGVRPDDVVALLIPRSVEWVIGMLATWKVGAAYSPFDQKWGIERIAGLVERQRHADRGGHPVLARAHRGTHRERGARRPDRARRPRDGVATSNRSTTPTSRTTRGRTSTRAPPGTRHLDVGLDRTAQAHDGADAGPDPTTISRTARPPGGGRHRVLIANSPLFDQTQKNIWVGLAYGGVLHLAADGFDPGHSPS